MKPFIRRCDRGRLAPVGWVSEPAGTWAGRPVEVVFDPERHQVVLFRNGIDDASRAALAGERYRRFAVDGAQELWARTVEIAERSAPTPVETALPIEPHAARSAVVEIGSPGVGLG